MNMSISSNSKMGSSLQHFLKLNRAEKGETITNTRIGSKDLNIYGVLTIRGSDTATNGSLAIQDDYDGINHLSNIGWNRSSGGPYMTYGLKQDGSGDWKSTFGNFSGERSFIKLDEDTFTLGHAPAQNTAVGTVVTNVTEKFNSTGK